VQTFPDKKSAETDIIILARNTENRDRVISLFGSAPGSGNQQMESVLQHLPGGAYRQDVDADGKVTSEFSMKFVSFICTAWQTAWRRSVSNYSKAICFSY
jgi:hypothetical protein